MSLCYHRRVRAVLVGNQMKNNTVRQIDTESITYTIGDVVIFMAAYYIKSDGHVAVLVDGDIAHVL